MNKLLRFFIIGGGLVILGLFSWMLLSSSILGNESAKWPVTQGAVTETRVIVWEGVKNRHHYEPEVTYSYSVKGKEYVGKRLTFDQKKFISRADAESVLQTYPVGKKLDIHYSPNDPQNSVLETGSSTDLSSFLQVLEAIFHLLS